MPFNSLYTAPSPLPVWPLSGWLCRILISRLSAALLCALLIGAGSLKAQAPLFLSEASKSASKGWQSALDAFKAQKPDRAWAELEALLDKEPGFVDAWLLATDVLDALDRDSLALDALEQAVALAPNYKPQAWARLGALRDDAGQPAAAADAWEAYARTASGEREQTALQEAARLRRLAAAMADPVPFNPVNLGDGINSSDPEYLPALRLDDSLLLFSRRIGGRNEDFFLARRVPDSAATPNWDTAVNIGPPVNTPLNEGAQQLSADGRTLFYTICHAQDGFGSCDLYASYRSGPERNAPWTEPRNLGPLVNTEAWESQPCPGPDGKSLYFTSNRPGGHGARDLWVTRLAPDGRWGKPENLGDSINTPGAEQAPFLHADGASLYFTSDRHGSLGGSDLFLSRRGPDGVWRSPENLGYPINTAANEGGLIVSGNGRQAYYASDRADSRGALDLYRFELPEALRPEPVSWLELYISDAASGKPMAATVEVLELESGKPLYRDAADPQSGRFLVLLPAGSAYLLHIRRKGYLFHSENVVLERDEYLTPQRVDVALQPIAEGAETVLRNVFFETGSAELDARSREELERLVQLLGDNPKLRIRLEGHTDNVGSPEANLDLSQRRAEAVQAFLVAAGVAASRLEAAGYGERRPVEANSTAEGRAANRRTSFRVIGGAE